MSPTIRPRLLHVITGLETGGAERMLARLLPRLDQFEHRVVSLTTRGPLAEPLLQAGITVDALGITGLTSLTRFGKLRAIIEEFKPDLVIGTLIHADLLVRLFGSTFGARRVISNVRVKLLERPWLLLFDRWTLHRADHVLFNAPSVAQFYRDRLGLSPTKITVVPNGLNMEPYAKKTSKQYVRQLLDLPRNTQIVLGVGRLHPQKDWPTLIEAVAHLGKSNVHLVLVGEGQAELTLRATAAHFGLLKQTHFLGRRTDIPELLGGADLFVLPTLYEGMSNAIVEAMAAGIPVITTAIPENQDIITDGITGRLVPTRDSQALSSVIDELLALPAEREQLGRAGQEHIRAHYELDDVVSQLHEFYVRQIRAITSEHGQGMALRGRHTSGAKVLRK